MGNVTFDLSGKRALITGGSRGIGLAIAEGLLRGGAEVAILARREEQLSKAKKHLEENGGKEVLTFSFNLEETEEIAGLYEDIVKQMGGGVDILVNCAGITSRANAEDLELEAWEWVHKLNLTAVFAMSQCFCRERKRAGAGGKIINIGSLMCHGARATTAAYASSKGGLLMLTKSLAVEWAKYGINVNAIGPGFIATELTAKLKADAQFNNWIVGGTPMGRWGEPGDIAGAAVFLASGASDFVTGQILYVDGGWLAAL